MRLILSTMALLFSLIVLPTAAHAGKNDDAWAQCLWEKVPTSAANWLALPKPGNREWSKLIFVDNNLAKRPGEQLTLTDKIRADLLTIRLTAACDAQIKEANEKKVRFKSNSIRKALSANAPDDPKSDQVDPQSHLCLFYNKFGVSGMSPGTGSFDDIKLKGAEEALKCYWIADDGSLTDPAIEEQMSEKAE